MSKPIVISRADYDEACESYTGWCTNCESFTTGCVEPDAHDYECEVCGDNTVMGAEDALMEGEITI